MDEALLMELFNNTKRYINNTEWDMQEQVDRFLREREIIKFDKNWKRITLPKIVLREFRIPEINRISDHVVLINNRTLANIECKLHNIDEVIKQAKDHLRWCDYSIICLPPDGRYVANSYKRDLIDNGIGLFYWFPDMGMFDFIYPMFNRKKDKKLRTVIKNRIIKQSKES